MISIHPPENNLTLTATNVLLISILVTIFLLLQPIASFGLGRPSSYLNQQQQHRTLALLLSYDGDEGGRLCDWNTRGSKGHDGGGHDLTCIPGVVDHCVWNLIGQPSGRSNAAASVAIDTDEGEHALGQVAMFAIRLQPQQRSTTIPKLFFSETEPDMNLIRHKLNSQMPPHVRVRQAAVLNGIFDAKTGIKGRQWHVPQPQGRHLDVKAMLYAAEKLCTEGNSSAVATSFDPRITISSCNDVVCQLESIQVVESPGVPGRFNFVFKGDTFMYKMVKGFVRALVAIGEKRLCPDELLVLGKSKPQLQSDYLIPKLRGLSLAPTHSIYLDHIQYNLSDDPFDGDRVIASSSDGLYHTAMVDDAECIASRYYTQATSRKSTSI